MKKIKILIPVYNDWKSLFKLLENINEQIKKWDAEVSVLIVNDSSTDKRENINLKFNNVKSIKILNMKKNKGHARCNATGLKYLIEKEDFDYVILMDGDGEDRPEELDLLFEKSKENPNKTVTANRIKRSEGFLFKLLYEIHKILTYVFTSRLIKFGNYSCLPKEVVVRLVRESSLWSSYSGSVTKIVLNRAFIPSMRGIRYFGPSKMNLLNLLMHSFAIIAVFKNTVITRSILFLIIYLFLVSNKISIITLFPVLAIFAFVFAIYKISSRENIQELNNSLENINSIDILSNSDGR